MTLPFAVLEGAILGRALPATARAPRGYQQWWYKDTRHQGWDGWTCVGWRVVTVDLAAETVTFATGPAPAAL